MHDKELGWIASYEDENVCLGCAVVDLAKEMIKLRKSLREIHFADNNSCSGCGENWPCPTIRLVDNA